MGNFSGKNFHHNLPTSFGTLPTGTTLSGDVVRVTYASEDSSYSVIVVQGEDGREYSVVGSMPDLSVGQSVDLTGQWEKHKEYGNQFRVSSYQFRMPVSKDGLIRYLSSGILTGIGKSTAEKIVAHFGKDTMHVLDTAPRRLMEIPGIGKSKMEAIRDSWQKNTEQRDMRIYLEGLGISPAYFAKIFKHFGADTVRRIQENPYCLASEVHGIGFLMADKIAQKAGIKPNDMKRLVAGISYAMDQIQLSGHVCFPRPLLLEKLHDMLQADGVEIERAMATAAQGRQIVSEIAPNGQEMVYAPQMQRCENELPWLIARLLNQPQGKTANLRNFLPLPGSAFSEEQLRAVNTVARARVSVITGGPGVGKTTVISELVRRARSLRLRMLLAAPTGRAAKRLSEATGMPAATIHRLLKWDPLGGKFVHTQDSPLDTDLIVIDESSMLDLPLSVALFRAIPQNATVVIVGDPDQLPSVGAGNVLCDLIDSNICPVTRLTKIFRQGNGSGIILAAHAVNAGKMPSVQQGQPGQLTDFYWIEKDNAAEAAEIIKKMIAERIPARFHFDPVREVQLLTPMNKGATGTTEMNRALQELLNGGEGKTEFYRGESIFRIGDKVMQTTNNYDKNVFNGDTGFIKHISMEDKIFIVAYDDGNDVEYQFDEADQITLAYAVTIHKSQGSEYPAVVVPLLQSHHVMLQRNLLYTGMTRAKKLMILIGSRSAVGTAVRNSIKEPRYSLLLEKLRNSVKKGR